MRKYCVVHRIDKIETSHSIKYSEKDMAFFTDSQPISDTALLYGYIEFGFNSCTMCIVGAGGFLPIQSWGKVILAIPDKITTGKLIVVGNFEPGMVYAADDKENSWRGYYDEKKNWVYLGNKDVEGNLVHVKFLKNVIVTLQKGRIQARWIDLNER